MTLFPDASPERRHRWPAEYYSDPAPRAVLPRGVALGCGAASALALLLLFAAGVWLSRGGAFDLFDLAVGMSMGEVRGMYAADVPAGARKSLEDEVETMRRAVRERRASITKLQPFLKTLSEATADGKVNATEARELETSAHAINASARH